jgi:hypothetical protein
VLQKPTAAAGEVRASKEYLDKSAKAFLMAEELALVAAARKVTQPNKGS